MNKNKEYLQALKNLQEVKERGEDAYGNDAIEFIDSLLTPEERAESDLRAAVMIGLIKARQERGISQKQLEQLSGVKQPVIARMERGVSSPQLETVLKVLAPLGLTLAVVPLSD